MPEQKRNTRKHENYRGNSAVVVGADRRQTRSMRGATASDGIAFTAHDEMKNRLSMRIC